MKNRKNTIRTMIIALGLLTGASIYAKNSNDEENNKKFSEVLKGVSSITLVDEVFDLEEYKNLDDRLDQLQEYINLSDELEKIDTTKEVDNYLDYETKKGKINDYIYKYGYETIEDAGKILVKAKIVETLNEDEENYKNVFIGENKNNNRTGEFYNPEVSYKSKDKNINLTVGGEAIFNIDSKLTILINDIYTSQNLHNRKNSDKDENGYEKYNSDRNKKLLKMIDDMKKVLYSYYKVDGDRIVEDYQKKIVNI